LSRDEVDLNLMGVQNEDQLRANLRGLEAGPLTKEEMIWMREFGRVVHG
jgi:aryl-alcohol dehydrogenase-like predicted oxidoreductase